MESLADIITSAHFSRSGCEAFPYAALLIFWREGRGGLGNAMPAVGGGKPSDAVLLRRLHGGQADAASTLYLRYALRIRRLAEEQLGAGLSRRLDPEDIVQSVFRTFFRRTKCSNFNVPEEEL
jgi:hypothetical protein